MYSDIRQQLHVVITKAVTDLYPQAGTPNILIETPGDKQHGEYTCNIALQLSRILKKNPVAIAGEITPKISALLAGTPIARLIGTIEVKPPGFINVFLSLAGFYTFLTDVASQNKAYGQSMFGQRQKFCLEFVSANPTGPLTVAHGRQAAIGDTLVNILNTVGYDAKKEYYVNDEGNQINILGRSIKARALQSLGKDEPFQEDWYQGDYVRTMAKLFMASEGITSIEQLNLQPDQAFRQFGVKYLMDEIHKDLEDFSVRFDIWSYQSKVADLPAIQGVLADLKTKGFVYEHEGAWWFKSTHWGDDKDRVVQKSNGDYTYLTPDIVYHKNKFERGFQRIVNLLGPDHHGYIPRIKAAAGALGKSPNDLDVIIVQLATIFRDGVEVSMSTRKGEFITLREVIDEVGKDAGRFFFLMRQASAHLEFDLEVAKRQNAENPVFYIQYAHARISSIVRKAAGEEGLRPKLMDLQHLNTPEEIDLMRKIGLYPEVLIGCAKTLEPFGLVRYLQELSASFHKFYDACRVIDDDKAVAAERLGLIEAARIVLGNGLNLAGVSAPEKM